jgi:membrane fusion protein (multidrug efflux system)
MNAIVAKPAFAPPDAQTRVAPLPSRRRQAVRVLRPLLGGVAAIAIAVTAAWYFTEGRWIESTDNAYVQGDIAVLGPRIEGDVAAIDVADNQRVYAGDPLIRLDQSDWQARLAQARASAAESAAAVLTAQRQIAQQQATIDAAEAAIAQAQAEQTRTAADAARSAALTANGWASHQANDLAIADQRKAAAALTSAQAQKSAAEQQIGVLAAQVGQAQAKAQNAAAAVKLAENNLAYTVIRAPFDGIAGNRAAELGQHVTPGQQLIAVAPLPDQLYVTANFKETELRHMRPGMKVRLIPDIDPGAAVDGTVNSLAPATGALFSLLPPENATGNFTKVVQRVPVKIAIDPVEAAHAGWLRAGLSVTAEVDTRGPQAQRLGLFGAAAATLRDAVPGMRAANAATTHDADPALRTSGAATAREADPALRTAAGATSRDAVAALRGTGAAQQGAMQ